MKYYIIAAVVVVGIAVAGLFIFWGKSKSDDAAVGQQTTNVNSAPQAAKSVKKSVKRFTLVPVAGKGDGIKGDGSITLKEDISSMGVRLITAPALASGEQYEAYLVLGKESPVLLGELKKIESPNEKYLWAAGGKIEWFGASKIMVTKRTSSGTKPGTIVAEAEFPAEGEPVPQQ